MTTPMLELFDAIAQLDGFSVAGDTVSGHGASLRFHESRGTYRLRMIRTPTSFESGGVHNRLKAGLGPSPELQRLLDLLHAHGWTRRHGLRN